MFPSKEKNYLKEVVKKNVLCCKKKKKKLDEVDKGQIFPVVSHFKRAYYAYCVLCLIIQKKTDKDYFKH